MRLAAFLVTYNALEVTALAGALAVWVRCGPAWRRDAARYQDLNRLAHLLTDTRDLDAAAEQYLFLLRYAKDSAVLHNDYGNVLLEQRKPDQAISEYGEAIRLDPGVPNAYNSIGICLAMKKNLDGATGE